jgi:hypothetical protein
MGNEAGHNGHDWWQGSNLKRKRHVKSLPARLPQKNYMILRCYGFSG